MFARNVLLAWLARSACRNARRNRKARIAITTSKPPAAYSNQRSCRFRRAACANSSARCTSGE